jgi:GDP-4-dehydro-6-deoxy-D-mannose reductase
MKKVLITGATGFVGQHLTNYLASLNQFEIYGTTQSSQSSLAKGKARLEMVDLLDFDSVSSMIDKIKPDLIYHLAAHTSPAESFDNPTPVVLGNIEMQMNLQNAIRKADLIDSRILIVSSGEVYGLIKNEDLPINEDTPFQPANPYAVSKVAQDFLGLQYYLSYKMDIVRVRPFNHTGPGQPTGFAIPSFAKQIALIEKGEQEPVIKVGNLFSARDFTDVRDIVRGYALLMDKGQNGDVYNIGSGKSISIKNMLDMLLSFSTTKVEVVEDRGKVRPFDTPNIYSDYSKLNTLTGWTPEIPIEQTLKDTLDYWRSIV